MKIYSFDIFDTCLVRKCGAAQNVFDILAFNVLGDDSPESVRMDFANIRIRAEQKTIHKTSKEEITLAEIYQNCDFSGLTSVSNDLIRQAEIDLEKQMLIPVYSVKKMIDELRKKGAQILFISDMYLPSVQILEVLIREELYKTGDKLYVSSEIGLRKHTGNLFRFIQKENNFRYKDWMHFGDNLYSDVRVPRKMGIKSKSIIHNYSFNENQWINNSYAPSFQYAHVLAGISRSIRLSQYEDIQIEFTASLIAPLYVCHVLRILEQAKKNGIQNLFFLARDGYILYLIAQRFQSLYPDIKFEYIYVSRKSLYLPGIFKIEHIDLYGLLTPEKGQSIREVLDRLSIDFSKITDNDFLDIELNASNMELLYDFLKKEDVINFIEHDADVARKLLIEYFIQVGLATKNNKNAIIDLRGTRTSHEMINNILTHYEYLSVEGFYFEVVGDRKQISTAGMYYADLYREKLSVNQNLLGIFQQYSLFEQFFSLTDQNRTIGYTVNEVTDEIIPIFENEIISERQKQIAHIHYQVIEEFSNLFLGAKLYNFVQLMYHATIIPNISKFGINPQNHYLAALNEFTVSDNKYKSIPFIKKFTREEWFYVFMFSRKIEAMFYRYKTSLRYNLSVFYNLYFFFFRIIRRIKRIIKV